MDNVKYTFLHAVSHACGFTPLFLTSNREEYHALRAKNLPVQLDKVCKAETLHKVALVVVDDFPEKMGPVLGHLQRKPFVQLWHGIPLKKIGFPEAQSSVNMTPEKARMLEMSYSGYAAVASTSRWVTEHLFSKVFRAGAFIPSGYPRNDVLLRAITPQDMINTDAYAYRKILHHKQAGGRVLLYMPTFRDTGGDFIQDKALDLDNLLTLCARHNILVVAKFHPYVRCAAFQELQNFIICESATDAYPLLRLADVLLTDYSSVYFDFLLLDRPIIFFAYDQHKYCTQDRELFFDYASMAPGPIATNQTELFAHILSVVAQGHDAHRAERHALRDKLFDHVDSHAAARLCAAIRDQLLPQCPV